MGFHGLFTNPQLRADLGVAQALGATQDDQHLAATEIVAPDDALDDLTEGRVLFARPDFLRIGGEARRPPAREMLV